MIFCKRTSSISIFRLILLILVISITETISAQNNRIQHPSIEPSFTLDQVLVATSKEKYSSDEIFKLALLFSECPLESETGIRCLEKFESIKTDVTADLFMELDVQERGRRILKYLYQNYLTKYNFDQTRIDAALETGVYNCVSSAMLYLAAAKAAGLDVRGQKTTQHAFCSVYIPSTTQGQLIKIDVETTNPYGFNPGTKETIENEENIKKYYVVPKKYYSNRLEVSDGVFAGLIAGNICSDCIKQGDYNHGVPLAAARYDVVRNENSKAISDVRQEFDVLAANYVNINPGNASLYYEVVEWFTNFIDRWGITPFLQKNMDNAFINLQVLCGKEKNYPLSLKSFNQFETYVTPQQLLKSEEIKADILFSTNTENASPDLKIDIINKLLSSEDYQSGAFQKRGALYLEQAWLEILNEYMNKKEYQTGIKKADEALTQLPQNPKIKNMRQYFYSNSIAIIHNNFAKEANSKKYDKALQIVQEGLELFPNDKTLKKDLSDLQKLLNQ